jgi:hypothetical protein
MPSRRLKTTIGPTSVRGRSSSRHSFRMCSGGFSHAASPAGVGPNQIAGWFSGKPSLPRHQSLRNVSSTSSEVRRKLSSSPDALMSYGGRTRKK